jgi:homoserine kinase
MWPLLLCMLDALQSEAGFDIKIYKNIKAGSGRNAPPVQRVPFGINELLGRPFEIKDLGCFAMQAKRALRKCPC